MNVSARPRPTHSPSSFWSTNSHPPRLQISEVLSKLVRMIGEVATEARKRAPLVAVVSELEEARGELAWANEWERDEQRYKVGGWAVQGRGRCVTFLSESMRSPSRITCASFHPCQGRNVTSVCLRVTVSLKTASCLLPDGVMPSARSLCHLAG